MSRRHSVEPLRDGALFADTTVQAPKGRPAASRSERLHRLADRILDRLEDEAEGGFASELYDLSEALWNVLDSVEDESDREQIGGFEW